VSGNAQGSTRAIEDACKKKKKPENQDRSGQQVTIVMSPLLFHLSIFFLLSQRTNPPSPHTIVSS
jgi:hypothetical protein